MKLRLIAICMFVITLLCGCKTVDNPSIDSTKASIEKIDVEQMLALSESQTYDVLDFYNDTALILFSEREKWNPDDVTDQLTTSFYEAFSIVDLVNMKETKRFPIQRFGICTSAVIAFDGVLCSMYVNNPDTGIGESIYYINEDVLQKIFTDDFSLFTTGPNLLRYGNDILFSYYTYTSDQFGLSKITPDFAIEPLLCFSSDDTDYLSDDFETSDTSYVYAVGEENRVTFYVGSVANSPIKVQLEEGEKIYGFDITDDTLLVSKECNGQETSKSYIEAYDLESGNCIHQIEASPPLYWLTANSRHQLCGVNFSTLKMFELDDDTITPIDFGDTYIQGNYSRIFSDRKKFLVPVYHVDSTSHQWQRELWLVSA